MPREGEEGAVCMQVGLGSGGGDKFRAKAVVKRSRRDLGINHER